MRLVNRSELGRIERNGVWRTSLSISAFHGARTAVKPAFAALNNQLDTVSVPPTNVKTASFKSPCQNRRARGNDFRTGGGPF